MTDQILMREWDSEYSFLFPESIENSSEDYYYAVEIMDADPRKAEMIFKTLIDKNPKSHIDAYTHLGLLLKEHHRPIEGNALIEKAFNIGLKTYKSINRRPNYQLPWSDLRNRPFLRACEYYGLSLMENVDFKEAAELFEFILKVNPNDNQGARYYLIYSYLRLEKYDDILRLQKRYEEQSHYFVFGKGLAFYLTGKSSESKKEFQLAKEKFPRIIEEILKSKHIQPSNRIPEKPDFEPFGVIMGSPLEAFLYWTEMKYYFNNKEIKEFIKQA